MSVGERSEKLVQIHRARNEWEGNMLVGYLQENGVDATLRTPPAMPPVDYYELFNRNETIDGVFVMEHEAVRARELIAQFLTAAPDEESIEKLAAQKPHPDRENIRRLRIAVREERRTFEFLGGLVVAFCVAGALFIPALWPLAPWTLLTMLVIVALCVGTWLRHKL